MGTCGFPTSRSRYYSLFRVVELQETFYEVPTEDRMTQLRGEAPTDFQFSVKAFQGFTHPINSPTYKRMRRTRLRGELGNYGLLRPTRENLELWGEFARAIKPLNPVIIVFQTPPSLELNEESFRGIREFFRSIEPVAPIAWEPRGSTYNNTQLLERLIRDLGIIHVTDPFRRDPLVITDTLYFRLHGIGKGEVNYSYKYTDEDLRRLRDKLINNYGSSSRVYVMFNNTHMLDDARRFKELVESGVG